MRGKPLMVLVVLVGASAFAGRRQQPERPASGEELLARPVANRGPSASSVDLAFQTAMLGSRTPGGAAINEACAESPERAVRFRGSTLREVLDDIVAADPDYVWQVNDGVVNLIPAAGAPELLALRIAAFDSGDARSPVTAITSLFALPQVRERAAELGLSQSYSGSGPYAIMRGVPSPSPLGVHVQDVTLLEALNAFFRANKHGVWVYRETHCGSGNFFRVYSAE